MIALKVGAVFLLGLIAAVQVTVVVGYLVVWSIAAIWRALH